MKRRALGILTAVIVAAMTILPMTGASAAEPLPVGAYDLTLDGSALSIVIDETGAPSITADDGLTVVLAYDETGRVLDHVRVETAQNVYEIAVEVAEDGSYTQTVTVLDEQEPIDLGSEDDEVIDDASEEPVLDDELEGEDEDEEQETDDDDDEAEAGHGQLVSTVARCAPRGRDAKLGGWPNHGTIVSAAANGLPLEIALIDPVTSEPMTLSADFGSLAGAQAFCSAVAAQQDAAAATADEQDSRKDKKDTLKEKKGKKDKAGEDEATEDDADDVDDADTEDDLDDADTEDGAKEDEAAKDTRVKKDKQARTSRGKGAKARGNG